MDIVDPYADAMFNVIRLGRLIGELDQVMEEPLDERQRRVVEEVHRAAAEARAMSGHLFIRADQSVDAGGDPTG